MEDKHDAAHARRMEKHRKALHNVDQVRRDERARQLKHAHILKIILLIFSIGGMTLIVGLLVGSSFFFGSALKSAVEEFGPKFTQSEVRLGDADLSILSGSAQITDLVIGNPQGFRTESAVRIGEVRIDLNALSLFEDVAHILELEVVAPELTYEIGLGGTNIDALRKNIAQAINGSQAASSAPAGDSSAQGKTAPTKAAQEGNGWKFVINNLYVRKARVEIAAPIGDTKSVTINEIHLKDVGKLRGGINAAEIADEVILLLSKKVTEATAGLALDPEAAIESLQEGVTESLQGDVEKGIEDGVKALQDLF
jgi:hypothetical protein